MLTLHCLGLPIQFRPPSAMRSRCRFLRVTIFPTTWLSRAPGQRTTASTKDFIRYQPREDRRHGTISKGERTRGDRGHDFTFRLLTLSLCVPPFLHCKEIAWKVLLYLNSAPFCVPRSLRNGPVVNEETSFLLSFFIFIKIHIDSFRE